MGGVYAAWGVTRRLVASQPAIRQHPATADLGREEFPAERLEVVEPMLNDGTHDHRVEPPVFMHGDASKAAHRL
jgi:hypothetical protein